MSLKKSGAAVKKNERILCRIIDANYNRSKEALRVLEDLIRFSNGAVRLSTGLKRARHHLTTALLSLPVSYRQIVACRDTQSDSGKKSLIRDKKKVSLADLLAANLQRSQEALRVLEECSKVINAPAARKFQKLRFDLYELEKNCLAKF